MLASDIPPVDEDYDHTIIRAAIDQEEQDIVQQNYTREDQPTKGARDVSPEL